jgi:uncharacterized membrane protein
MGTMRLERAIVIERPAEEVFAFVSDPTNLPAWQSTVVGVHVGSDPVAVGSRFGDVRHFGSRRFETTVEVTALEPCRRLDLHVTGAPVPIDIRHVFEEENGGTRLRISIEGRPRRALRLAAIAMTKAAEHAIDADLARLKKLLEARDG